MPAATAIESQLAPRSVAARALKVPLIGKLAGANALIVVVAWIATWLSHRSSDGDYNVLLVLGVALVAGLLVNAILVSIALRPIRLIEQTAERFWKGDLAVRVPWSAVADRDIERLSEALNLLLETNEQERIRLRALTEGMMRYEEHVRVETARVLQESHAQTLAGLVYHISAAIAVVENEDCRTGLEEAREIAKRGMEDLRDLSSRVHPRLLDDFGLIAAIRQLARTLQKETESVRIDVSHEEVFTMRDVSKSDKAVLYRVTEEALRNALLQGADEVHVNIRGSANGVVVDVIDNGRGVDSGTGASVNATLWLMRERLAFIGGSCIVRSDASGRTRLTMRLPLGRAIIEGDRPLRTPEPHAA